MNHPTDAEWLAYLDGEAAPEAALRLDQHLEKCPQCAAEIDGWRHSADRLRRLDWPVAAPAQSKLTPALRWAAAAALILGLGFALGRLSGPSAHQLRRALAADLKAQQKALSEQLSHELVQAVREARAQDRQFMLAWAGEFQQQRTVDYLSLRQDLETLASVADASLRQANWRLTEIASISQPTSNP